MKGAIMKLDELRQKRDKLTARLKALDAEIARAERAQREQEQREILKLIQARGLTAAQLEKLLNSGAGNEKDDMPAQ
jgi:predicted phage gp36 major capsid-like protein